MAKEVSQLILGDHNPYENVDLLPEDRQGWGSDSVEFHDAILSFKPKLIVEVGSWKGASAIHMASLCKKIYGNSNFEIVCIDTFLGSFEHRNHLHDAFKFVNGRPNVYEQFLSNVIHTNNTDVITPFVIDSYNGAVVLTAHDIRPDLIYIDASHDHLSVKRDLVSFGKLLNTGGVILGDDAHHYQIADAWEETFMNYHKVGNKFIWRR